MKKEGEQNTEDLRSLFKILQNDNKVYASDIDKLSKRIDKLTEDGTEKDSKDQKEANPNQHSKWKVLIEVGGGSQQEEESRQATITHFPNKKTALGFEEFSELYEQAYSSSLSDDAMISAIFEMFDYDKDGKVDVLNIKKMLEAFGFKCNGQDIRSKLIRLTVKMCFGKTESLMERSARKSSLGCLGRYYRKSKHSRCRDWPCLHANHLRLPMPS
jgi:Ca2+-binding EF-hand superfamily protein